MRASTPTSCFWSRHQRRQRMRFRQLRRKLVVTPTTYRDWRRHVVDRREALAPYQTQFPGFFARLPPQVTDQPGRLRTQERDRCHRASESLCGFRTARARYNGLVRAMRLVLKRARVQIGGVQPAVLAAVVCGELTPYLVAARYRSQVVREVCREPSCKHAKLRLGWTGARQVPKP